MAWQDLRFIKAADDLLEREVKNRGVPGLWPARSAQVESLTLCLKRPPLAQPASIWTP